jgi:hypothetical protein
VSLTGDSLREVARLVEEGPHSEQFAAAVAKCLRKIAIEADYEVARAQMAGAVDGLKLSVGRPWWRL